MQNEKTIRFCYRKIIDASSVHPWDKHVSESSFAELQMQAQLYNPEKKYRSFAELLINVPAAEKLHFLVSASIVGYLQQLKGIIPDIQDNLGRRFMPFSNYRFEIINADLQKKETHTIAINFFSDEMTWHDTVGNYMLVSSPMAGTKEDMLTHLVELKPFLSIYSIKRNDDGETDQR